MVKQNVNILFFLLFTLTNISTPLPLTGHSHLLSLFFHFKFLPFITFISNHFFSLSLDILYQLILSSSLVSEVAIDAFIELLKLFYKKHTHVSSTKTTHLIVCFLGFFFFFFVFLIIRTLIAFLSQCYSFSQKLVVIILIVIVVGICNTMISDILTDLITTLILGLAIPRILNILELLNQMEEFVKLFFFFFYVTILIIL